MKIVKYSISRYGDRMEPAVRGQWVRLYDHRKVVKALTEEIEDLRAQLRARTVVWRSKYVTIRELTGKAKEEDR